MYVRAHVVSLKRKNTPVVEEHTNTIEHNKYVYMCVHVCTVRYNVPSTVTVGIVFEAVRRVAGD